MNTRFKKDKLGRIIKDRNGIPSISDKEHGNGFIYKFKTVSMSQRKIKKLLNYVRNRQRDVVFNIYEPNNDKYYIVFEKLYKYLIEINKMTWK